MALRTAVRDHPLWVVVGLALLFAVGYVVTTFIGTVIFGLFIYYATRPVYQRIVQRVGQPSVAAGISIFALVLPALGLVGYALLIVFRELNQLTDWTALDPQDVGIQPEVYDQLTDPAFVFSAESRQFVTAELVGSVLGSLTSAIETVTVLTIVLINLFAMVALAFYLLRDDHRLGRWLMAEFDDRGTLLQTYLTAVDRDLNSIFFGNILNAVFTGTIGVITYSLLNVVAPPNLSIPAAALVGLLAGVASLIPVIGMKLIYIPVGLYMAGRSLVAVGTETFWFVILFFAVSFVIVDSIPDLVLRPYVSGKNIHVGALMLAYTLGPLLFGWYGLFLMPVLLVLVVQFTQVVLPELLREASSTPKRNQPRGVVGVPLRPSAEPIADNTSTTTDSDETNRTVETTDS